MHDATRSARRTPRQSRSHQTVEAVLAAVPLVLKRYGAGAMTTNRIAEVAGVSIGSLYQYFPDKQSVFGTLHERHAVAVRQMLDRHLAAQGVTSFRECVVALVEDLVDVHSVDTELHQLVTASLHAGPAHFRAGLHGVFAKALTKCDVKDMNRVLLVLPSLVEGLVHGVTRSPLASRDGKGEAVKVTRTYLDTYPELGY